MNKYASLVAVSSILASTPSHASDHLDTAAVVADPAADIGDLYAWMSPDRKRLNLVMTIAGKKFSDHVRYAFHVDSGQSLGETTAMTSIECDFNVAVAPECRLGDDRARGDASVEGGIRSEQRRFRVFAGLRDDPFFNNVRGTRAALNVAAAALQAGAPRDAAGCPRFDAATTARIRDEWRHTEGHAGSNLLAGWQTAALVIEVDVSAVDGGGPLLGAWATTTVRAAPPGHPPLEAGAPIDRMGRVLTGNALIGTFDTEQASDARKQQYNRAPREVWAMFAQDLAETLAIYDGFDGVCGNQWLAGRRADVGRYVRLAMLLADDRIWIDSRSGRCGTTFAVERRNTHDCGGRTPDHDAVDVFRSLLVMGRRAGVDDGVARDDRRPSVTAFPFLAPPDYAASMVYDDIDSPVGRLRLIATDAALVGIWFEHGRDAGRGVASLTRGSNAIIERTRAQLAEYFAGARREFDLPLEPRGTEFQRRVWFRLTKIAYGDTTTYGALAQDLGNSYGSRAVGLANGSNPIPIVIPCHRVIGADGSLTGFGGGLPIKAMLLDLERAATQPRLL